MRKRDPYSIPLDERDRRFGDPNAAEDLARAITSVHRKMQDSDAQESAPDTAHESTRGGVRRKKSLPPVHLWNPPDCGALDMRIARDGSWWYMGTPIGRIALVELFASVLRKDGEAYYLVTPVEKVRISVDDAPFLAVDFRIESHDGLETLVFETNVGDEARAGLEHPLRVVRAPETGEPSPYIHIRDNLEALIDRKSFYRLVDVGRVALHEGVQWFGVHSQGVFFPIIPAEELYGSG